MTDIAIPVAAGAGIGAVIVAILGVEPQTLIYGFVGASIGISFAPQAGRVRTAFLFLAVVMACALLGTWVAERYFESRHIARNGVALLTAIVFHPLLSGVVANIPSLIDWVLKKAGVKA